MSLVMAFCLSNNDVLFVADKISASLDQEGNMVGATRDATKWVEYSNGMIGYAGFASLAQDIIRSLSPLTETDVTIELQRKLCEQYHRLTAFMPEHIRETKPVEFMYSAGRDRIYVFKSREGFSPELVDWWAGIGCTGIATLVYFIFYNGDIKLNLEAAKRLAALQIHTTADANPSAVSQELDMWVLRAGQSKPEAVTGIDGLRDRIRRFRALMITELYR